MNNDVLLPILMGILEMKVRVDGKPIKFCISIDKQSNLNDIPDYDESGIPTDGNDDKIGLKTSIQGDFADIATMLYFVCHNNPEIEKIFFDFVDSYRYAKGMSDKDMEELDEHSKDDMDIDFGNLKTMLGL